MTQNQDWPPAPDPVPGPYSPGPVYPPDTTLSQPLPGGPTPPNRGRGLGTTLAVALLAGVLGGAGTYLVMDRTSTEPLPQSEASLSPPAEGSIAAVVDRVLPSVVTLEVSSGTTGASGSGFILTSDGYVLTNNHVIALAADGAGSIIVVLSDGSSLPGTLVGRNSSYDLAVVKVDKTDLTAAALGNSDNIAVGDTAIAIGAPLGLSETVTSGIISALDRPVTAGGVGETAFINAVQTDAAINPGNSGGPLLNGAGEVVAVNSAIASLASTGEQAGSIGLGFAIPINQAKRIADEIISTGSSTTPVIGVTLDLRYTGEGARIATVEPGGAADQAGLQPGDIVVEVNGKPVANATEFIVQLRSNAPGDTVELTLAEGSTVKVTLQGRQES